MYIKDIELYNFRNYKEQKVSFSKGVNIFIGKNAQGKTNLLEGIYLNAFGKSFKNVKDKELIKFGEEYCRIKAVSESEEGEKTTEIVIKNDGRKGIKKDGVKISKASELLDRIFIIIFSPEDLRIVKDEPEKRRRFINRELCQIRAGYLSDLNDYGRILKQRNIYLRNLGEMTQKIYNRTYIRKSGKNYFSQKQVRFCDEEARKNRVACKQAAARARD